jgi:hypothetical protein
VGGGALASWLPFAAAATFQSAAQGPCDVSHENANCACMHCSGHVGVNLEAGRRLRSSIRCCHWHCKLAAYSG